MEDRLEQTSALLCALLAHLPAPPLMWSSHCNERTTFPSSFFFPSSAAFNIFFVLHDMIRIFSFCDLCFSLFHFLSSSYFISFLYFHFFSDLGKTFHSSLCPRFMGFSSLLFSSQKISCEHIHVSDNGEREKSLPEGVHKVKLYKGQTESLEHKFCKYQNL